MANPKLAISFSGILCPTNFLMIEIIYDHRMSLRDSAVRHFIIHKGTIILLSHFLCFYFKCFKVAAVMLVIDLVVKWYKIRIFSGDIIHNCLFETASKIEIFEPEQIALIIYPLKDCFKIRDTREYRGYETGCPDNGRPSMDPVMLIKVPFIQYLYGIKSMRQTMKEIEVNVAYRWFLGLDMLDPIPHFSTFGKNYTRRFKDTDLFEQIFSKILEKRGWNTARFLLILKKIKRKEVLKEKWCWP